MFFYVHEIYFPWRNLENNVLSPLHKLSRNGARICKHLRSPGIFPKESIAPAYVAWRAGTITLFVISARQAT